jgi:hypothetical protein
MPKTQRREWRCPLLGPGYYRRQADICLGLSLLTEDSVIAMELIAKANEFLAKAQEVERNDEVQVPPAHVVDCDELDGGDVGRD